VKFNLFVSFLRTGIPSLVGWLVSLAAAHGLDLDEGVLAGGVTPIATVTYYGMFRLAEQHLSPKFGWLLGYARPPAYESAPLALPRT
jgi:hypothetical protein